MLTTTVLIYALFWLVAAFHIGCRAVGKYHWSQYTKPLLMPLIIAAFTMIQVEKGFTWVGIVGIIYLAFGWLGDVLLLGSKDKPLIAGGLCFALGHFLTIGTIIALLAKIETFDALSFIYHMTLASFMVVGGYYALKDYHRHNPHVLPSLGSPLIAYITVLSTMFLLLNAYASQSVPEVASIAATGAAAFYLSDWTLLRAKFKGTSNSHSSIWMLLCCLAQNFITIVLYLSSLH